MRLALRGDGVHVAKAPLERAAVKDRVDARGAESKIDHAARLLDGARNGDTQLRALFERDSTLSRSRVPEHAQHVEQIRACRLQLASGLGYPCLNRRMLAQRDRRPVHR